MDKKAQTITEQANVEQKSKLKMKYGAFSFLFVISETMLSALERSH